MRIAGVRSLMPLVAPLALAACTLIPQPASTPPAPDKTAVALGQSVSVGDLVVTPAKVIEDSRCPINARCVWAGRLIVETRVDGAGWRESAPIELGEGYTTHGTVIVLTSAEPGRSTDRITRPEDYRFTYEAGWNVGTDPGPPLHEP